MKNIYFIQTICMFFLPPNWSVINKLYTLNVNMNYLSFGEIIWDNFYFVCVFFLQFLIQLSTYTYRVGKTEQQVR